MPGEHRANAVSVNGDTLLVHDPAVVIMLTEQIMIQNAGDAIARQRCLSLATVGGLGGLLGIGAVPVFAGTSGGWPNVPPLKWRRTAQLKRSAACSALTSSSDSNSMHLTPGYIPAIHLFLGR